MLLSNCFSTQRLRFFQTLMKNPNHSEILSLIDQEKKIDFFAKNYLTFLQTQEQLLSLKVPELKQIPKAKEYHLKTRQETVATQNLQEATVLEIIDNFAAAVLQKNKEETVRVYRMIKEMKEHSKYKSYFAVYEINKLFREAYINFVQNCEDVELLLSIGEGRQGIKVFLCSQQKQICQKVNIELKIDSSLGSLKKCLKFLLSQLQSLYQTVRVKFREQLKKQGVLLSYFSHFLRQLVHQFYQIVEVYIYDKEDPNTMMKCLSELLEKSKELQLKGISLHEELRREVAQDLPRHLQKIIEVIMESFDTIMKTDKTHNQLFQYVQLSEKQLSMQTIYQYLNNEADSESVNHYIETHSRSLKRVATKDYGKACGTKKIFLLLNSFFLILLPLCHQQWAFMHENILDSLISKVKETLSFPDKYQLHKWDYYHLYIFLDRLSQGKVQHRRMFNPEDVSLVMKERQSKIKRLSQQYRVVFESKMINDFWLQILSEVPSLLWQFKKYAESQQKHSQPKPTLFGITLIFQFQAFLKQVQFRVSKEHFEYLVQQYYEFLIFVIEYVIFWSYHDRATNKKVFTLYNKQEKIFNLALQEFNLQNLSLIRQGKILKLSVFTKPGLQRFVVDFYFITDVLRTIGRTNKIKADDFLYKVAKILAKEMKNEPLQTERSKYSQLLKQFLAVYEKQPEVIKKYLVDKRSSSRTSLQSSKLSESSSKHTSQI